MVGQNAKVKEVLTRGVVEVLPSRKGLADLMKSKKIKLYLGVDPTSPYIHLGHTLPLKKLQQFQDLGHETILLIGNFTSLVGDPSERDEQRKVLTEAQIKENMSTYKKQASKVLDFSKVKIKYNADWLAKLNFKDLLKLASNFTTAQLLERDMFQRRISNSQEIWLNEFLYPLMQGYDSVAMNVDLEIGGTDQTFNMLAGRKLQKIYNQTDKFVLSTPILIGLDGRKMSKTYGNTINVYDSPNNMYGKVMSMKDELIGDYFELCTNIPLKELKEIRLNLKFKKTNPKDFKIKLAKEIVTIYHSKKDALKAEQEFQKVFQKKELPSKIKQVSIKAKKLNILDLLIRTGLVSSKSEAKRLILQKGVKIDGQIKEGWQENIIVSKKMVIQVGKRKFAQII